MFTVGQGLLAACTCRYATAISPASRKATGRVKKPSRSKAPPKVSSMPANQISDSIGGGPPPCGIPAGKPKSFMVPASVKMMAATMRRLLLIYGALADHFARMPDDAMIDGLVAQGVRSLIGRRFMPAD